MKIALAGCGGLIGKRLITRLEKDGHTCIRLVRPQSQKVGDSAVSWDPANGVLDPDELAGYGAVVNLGGANIGERAWSPRFKEKILKSRVLGSTLISKTLAAMETPPPVFLNASATGYYGDRGDSAVDESAAAGEGFLAEVCVQWEAATEAARQKGVRVVNARIGVVLAREGGALNKMLTPFKLGLGGKIGKGHQYMSWIGLEDVVEALVFCLNNQALSGPVNLVAPNPVTNRGFAKQLGNTLHRPTILPLPAWAVSLGLGEMGRTLLLGSTRVTCRKLKEAGFVFRHEHLTTALEEILA